MIVSNHSPGGTPLQLSLAVTWTVASTRQYTLNQLADWMCRGPARLAGLARKGAIEVGYDADLVVWNPEAEFTVEPAALEYFHPVTPYPGRRLRGVVERTYLRGTRIYERGTPLGRPRGRLIGRSG